MDISYQDCPSCREYSLRISTIESVPNEALNAVINLVEYNLQGGVLADINRFFLPNQKPVADEVLTHDIGESVIISCKKCGLSLSLRKYREIC